MRIAVFVGESAPRDGGGFTIQQQLIGSLAALSRESSHEFVVFGSPDVLRPFAGVLECVEFPGSIRSRVAGRMRVMKQSGKPLDARRFDDLATRNKIDFVWFLGAVGVHTDFPYLATVWDLQHRLQPWFPEVSAEGQWDLREEFLSGFLRRAAGIIVGTNAGREEVHLFYEVPRERIHILPHPTPDTSSPESADRTNDVGAKGSFVLYPAQFWAHKNHATLLRAAKLLSGDANPVSVVLVGSDKGEEPYVRQLAQELGISAQVKFAGFVSRAALITLYKQALALTYPSFFGPENLPPLEAFALGCPVIAANVSGAEEQLGDAAILFDPRDPEALAAAIRRVRDDHALRAQLTSRGLETARERTSTSYVKSVFSLLDDFAAVRQAWPAPSVTSAQ